jgi:hypothetical protein
MAVNLITKCSENWSAHAAHIQSLVIGEQESEWSVATIAA